jgi:RimJ/RimL family protein N-acetyltransferase
VSSIPEHITTPRLVLRCWQGADAPALRVAIDASLAELRQWLVWAVTEPTPVEELTLRLEGFAHRFRNADGDWGFGLFERGARTVLGSVGLHRRDAPDALEIGYWLRTDAMGRGFATEAVRALTEVALTQSGAARVEIRCDPRNVRSIAVARRAGFRHLTTLAGNTTTPSGEPRDTMVWERRYFPDPEIPATTGG